MPADTPDLIPAPVSIERRDGFFTLTPTTEIAAAEPFQAEAELFAAEMNLPLAAPGTAPTGSIHMEEDLAPLPPGSYHMTISRYGVRISATGPAGAFHATRTLRMLLLDGPVLPAARIEDRPRFGWRGLMLDSCRHFISTDYIKLTIDRMALLKMNRLHWHLTDDQGWRLEIPSLPRLTEVGAWRDDGKGGRYGGFYTADDVRELVEYAEARQVMLVPEIEMPGHCTAALAAYPELSCTGGPFTVATDWGIFDDVLCVGGDKVLGFIEEVLDHVVDLFPSRYIHIGGDECPRTRWLDCPRCRSLVETEGLGEVDGLQSWLMWQAGQILAKRGRRAIGWDEIADGGLLPGATVQSWRGFEGAIAAVRHGHQAIVSPTSHAYFDYPLDKIDVRKVYEFEPVPEGLSAVEASRIIGGEANMWTERVPEALLDVKLYPRLLAMAERLWSPASTRDFENFRRRLLVHYPRLDKLGIGYGKEKA